MKKLVTVTRVGDNIRVSLVSAHGEEILEPDVETKALAILLWRRLSQEEPSGGQPLLPWDSVTSRLDKLTTAVEKLTARIDSHTHAMDVLQSKLAPTKPTPVPRGQ